MKNVLKDLSKKVCNNSGIKTLSAGLFVILFSLSVSSCKKCSGEDPRARIVNNGTSVADVQIKTSGGNTVNINGVAAGTKSEFSTFAAGATTFTVNVNKQNYVKAVDMAQCFEYDITIDANNVITSIPTDRNE